MKKEEKAVPPSSTDTEEECDFWLKDITPHRNLEDEYFLGDVIGRGTSSTVYKCLRKGRTEWACKILKKNQLNRNVLESSIRQLLKLKHPNIVQLKEVFETKEEIQLILELAYGGELFERIVERGQYSEVDAARAVRHILNALQYLHTNGIIHRDLKPENLLYKTEMEDSVLKLADCGMSTFVCQHPARTTNTSLNLGYTAPEILLGKHYDCAVDLWSLGVVTYIMLCGFEPFWDDEGEEKMRKKITEGEYSFPSPWWDDISHGAKDIISKLLSVNPSDRPSADKCLNHPWVLGISTPALHMNDTVLRLKEFNAKRRFRVATKAVIATRRALNLLSPAKRNSMESECSRVSAEENRNNDDSKCCRNLAVEGSACSKCCRQPPLGSSTCSKCPSSKTSQPPIDGEHIGKTNQLTSELSQYKENYVGLS